METGQKNNWQLCICQAHELGMYQKQSHSTVLWYHYQQQISLLTDPTIQHNLQNDAVLK